MNDQLITIIIASENPVKIAVAKDAFMKVFSEYNNVAFKGCKVESGIENTPLSRDRTEEGALNRLKVIRDSYTGADYYVAIEGGFNQKHKLENYRQVGYVMVGDRFPLDHTIEVSVPEFILPTELSWMIEQGKGCGASVDELQGVTNSKQNGGITGYVTNGLATRYDTYFHSLVIAFSQLKNYDKMYK